MFNQSNETAFLLVYQADDLLIVYLALEEITLPRGEFTEMHSQLITGTLLAGVIVMFWGQFFTVTALSCQFYTFMITLQHCVSPI